jgi:hypothetical protein
MTNAIKPINYKNYPGCMFAMLSAFVEPDQAKVLRSVAGDAVVRTENDGCTYKNGLFHSFDDQPAIVHGENFKEWLKDGKWHREGDKPAVIRDGIFEYYDNDVLHRIGGPAVTSDEENFRHEWWENGKRHRIGGPAVYDEDIQEWWENGKRHRIDGPAVVHKDHIMQWWENGVFIRREEMPLYERLYQRYQGRY